MNCSTNELIQKSGAWFSFGEERIGQGRQNVKRFLAENTDIRDKIKALVLEQTALTKKTKEESNSDQEEKAGK